MEGTKRVPTVPAALLVVFCMVAFAIAGKNPGGSGAGTLIGARFSAATSIGTPRITSDGNYANLCAPVDADYVDKTATCTNLAAPNAEQASISQLASGSLYFLRTIPVCCETATSPSSSDWQYYAVYPSRWLVLDFSDPVSGSSCFDIDTQIANNVFAITKSPGGWEGLPPPVPPTPVAGCVDHVVVRFSASQAFSPGATSASVSLHIDQPELQKLNTGGYRIYWDALYNLQFEQPVPITGPNSTTGAVTLSTSGSGGSDVADLFRASDNTLVGKYHMPFSVTLTPVK